MTEPTQLNKDFHPDRYGVPVAVDQKQVTGRPGGLDDIRNFVRRTNYSSLNKPRVIRGLK